MQSILCHCRYRSLLFMVGCDSPYQAIRSRWRGSALARLRQDPTPPGVVLVGDAAGRNDPILGQGLSIALRDVRLVSEAILAGGRDPAAFRPYVEERLERMRRRRITASLVATLRAEYGEEACLRRRRAGRRLRVDKMLSPLPASLVGSEKLPAAAFEPATIDALLAP